jgi:hypothetical protein
MWEFLEAEARNLDGTTTMVYRLEPVISRPARQHCIGQHVGCFSRDQVFREYGSGVYQFYVKDASKKLLYTESSSFHNPNFPPRLDPLELVASDPKNQPYLQMFKLATENKSPFTVDAARKDDIAEILRAHSDASKLDPIVIEWLKDMTNKRDDLATKLADGSAKSPSPGVDLPELVKALASIMPSPSPSADPLSIVDKVLTIQNRAETDVERVWTLVERVQGNDRREEAPNPLNTLKETLGVFSEVKDLFKSEAPATVVTSDNMEGWQALTSSVMQSLPAMFTGFAAVVSAFKGGTPVAASQMNVPPAAPRPTSFDPYRDAAAAREYARSQNAAAAAATPGNQSGNQQQGSAPNSSAAPSASQQASGMEPVLALMMSAISCMQRGVDGHHFADSVIVMQNEMEYEGIVNQIEVMTIPAIVALAKAAPQIGDYVTKFESQFIRFIQEFVEGPDAEDDSEPESRSSIKGLDRDSKPKSMAAS